MRLTYVSLPLSLLLVAGGIYLATRPAPVIEGDLKDLEPRHPVTQIMLEESERMKLKLAPDFSGRDTDGKTWTRDELSDGKPTVFLFIKYGCPCSIDAQPIFNKLSEKFKGKANFVGVIDVEGAKASQWVTENRPSFRVLTDPELKIVRAYEAKNSVYTFLVGQDHRIEKLWPGYWVDMLKELNSLLSKDVQEKQVAFDTLYAPKAPSSGCTFMLP